MTSPPVPSAKMPPQPKKAASPGMTVAQALHWLFFLVLTGAMSWVYFHRGSEEVLYGKPRNFSALETRHLELTRKTTQDFHPDFSHSFSEPLKGCLPHRTDGVIQPLWPWISAWMLDGREMAGNNPVEPMNWAQLGWTLGWLLLLGLACARKFTLPATLLVMLLAGFEGFLPTVGPFTSGALFQVLFLLTWVACIFALQRNSLWVYGLVGGLGALAYLAEDRVLPLLLVFVFVGTLRAGWEWLMAHFPREAGTTLWVPRNHGIGLLFMAAVFFFIIGPRLAESHQRFGDAFFTYHDQVRWLDDAKATQAWMQQHPDTGRVQSKNLLELVQGYRQGHTHEQWVTRFREGLSRVWTDFVENGGAELGVILALLFAMTLAMKWATPKATHAGQRLHPESIPALLFMVAAAGSYIAIAAWDAPITGEEGRLTLLQAPLALGILWGCESLLRRARRRKASRDFMLIYHFLLWALAGLESWRVIAELQTPLSAP